MHTTLVEKLVLAVLLIVAVIFFIRPLAFRIQRIKLARGSFSFDRPRARLARWFREVVFQGTVIAGRPWPGVAHALVFWGFIVFLPETADMLLRALFNSQFGLFGNSTFHEIYQMYIGILFCVLASVSIAGLLIRRVIIRPKALGSHLSFSSLGVAILILILMITYFIDVFFLKEGTVAFRIDAWVHIVSVMTLLVLIPRSKHYHLFLSLFTTYTKDFELAAIKPLELNLDDESGDGNEDNMYLGAEKFTDLSKHTVLGAFTCVECGRCFDNCPARLTGKQLDPKQLMLNLRDVFIREPGRAIADDDRFTKVIWQCTTCGACTFQCPVGIDQPIPILEMRRGYVANSVFPDTMRTLFDNLESTGNPWNYQPTDAADFLVENEFPEYEHDTKVLYWMGCMGRYNDEYRKTAIAFKKLLNAAGVNFGVLIEEQCTGDAARRAGNEFLFKMLADTNIETLNEAEPETIVTTCPHCLRTLKEYKQMGLKGDVRIVHHTEYLLELIESGALTIDGKVAEKITYHDACYLSRYLDDRGYLNPRELLAGVGVELIEPERTKRKSFCCGAGGGMLFSEETEGTRINHTRVEELMKTGAEELCIACPFCQMMLKDGYTDKGVAGMRVKDVAEILVECLES